MSGSLQHLVEEWLAPMSVAEFRATVFGRSSLHSPASPDRLAALDELCSWTVDEFLARRSTNVSAWFQSTDGRHQTAAVSTTAGRRLYDGGTTLYMPYVAELAPLVEALAAALEVPSASVVSGVFCNRPGAVTTMHFDPVDTITVQISGSKVWRIAPNRHAPNPIAAGWATGSTRAAVELTHYGQWPMPQEMPPDTEEFRLTAGDMLYVPRGWWHETESDEDAVSLHLHYSLTPWLDVVLATIRSRLLHEPALRASADGIWDPSQRAAMVDAAERARASVMAATTELSVADFLPDPPDRPAIETNTTVVRRPLAGLWFDDDRDSPGNGYVVTVVVNEHTRERETTLQMSAAQLEGTQLLATASSSTPLTPNGIAALVDGLSLDESVALADTLVGVGLLRVASHDRQLVGA